MSLAAQEIAEEAESSRYQLVHAQYPRAQGLTGGIIAAAIEVHRNMGAGLLESIYERCLGHEPGLRSLKFASQRAIHVQYKGLSFEEPLRFDLLVESCVLVENKCVDRILPIHKAQLLSYMKLLDVPLGLLINFHEPLLKNGIHRMIFPGADRA